MLISRGMILGSVLCGLAAGASVVRATAFRMPRESPNAFQYDQFTLRWQFSNVPALPGGISLYRRTITVGPPGPNQFIGISFDDENGVACDEFQIDGSGGRETVTLDFSFGAISRLFPYDGTIWPYGTTISFYDPNTYPASIHSTLILIGGTGDDQVSLDPGRITFDPAWDTSPSATASVILYNPSATQVIFKLGGGANSVTVNTGITLDPDETSFPHSDNEDAGGSIAFIPNGGTIVPEPGLIGLWCAALLPLAFKRK